MFAKIAFGSVGSLIVKIIIIINNFGLCCSYFIIFGTTCHNLAEVFLDKDSIWVTNYHSFIYILFIFFVMFLLIYKENLDSLKSASFIGVTGLCTFFVCLVIIFFYKISIGKIPELDASMLWPSGNTLDIIGCLPTVFLAYTFQFNVFPIFFTLKNRSNKEMLKSTILGVSFCFVVYILTGIMGFVMYRDNLNDTILQALTVDVKGQDKFLIVLIVIINVGFMFSSTMSIPLMFFSLKNNFVNSILFCKKKFGKIDKTKTSLITHDKDEEITTKHSISPFVKNIIVTLLYMTICFISIVIPTLKAVFGLVGSTAANSISFILPNLLFVKLASMSKLNASKVLPFVLFILGIVVLVVCLVGEILRLTKE